MLNTDRDFGQYLYDRLPEIYRIRDAEIGVDSALLRFLQVLQEGGIAHLFSETLDLYDLLQVDTMPSHVLPLMAQLLGYEYREDLEEDIQRKIIQNLIELYKRKGTKSVLNFIAREFTKYDTQVIETEYRIFRTWSPNPRGIPSQEYVEPRTLGNTAPDHNTCHLISVNGKYDGRSIIIIFDSSEERITLLNNLLAEFLPIYCKLYLQVRGSTNIDSYEDSVNLQVTDNQVRLQLNDVEDVEIAEAFGQALQPLKDVESVTLNATTTVGDRVKHKTLESSTLNVSITEERNIVSHSTEEELQATITEHYTE